MTTGTLADTIRSALPYCALIPLKSGMTVTDEAARHTLRTGAITGSEDDFWAFSKEADGSGVELHACLKGEIIYIQHARSFRDA